MTTLESTKPAQSGKLASTAHVETLIRHYKQERWLRNSDQLGMPDSLSTWYGLDELESFLTLARDHQADGIKIYYGVYPADYPEQRIAGRQTVVLVATRRKQTGYGIANKNIYVTRNGQSEILAFNFGHLCPPDCVEDGWPPFEMEHAGIAILEHNGEIKIA